jgi:hypothetical protein
MTRPAPRKRDAMTDTGKHQEHRAAGEPGNPGPAGCADGARPAGEGELVSDADAAAAGRAKTVLQAEYGMTEPQAHRWLRETAMNERRSLRDVCEAVINWTMMPEAAPCVAESRYPEAACKLRADITGGTRAPGSRVRLSELQSAYGIASTSARKLLRELVGEGLLRHDTPHGYYVTELPSP